MSKLTVTVTEQVSNVAVTEQVIEVNEAVGIGPQGIAGVVSATAPVTYNSGTQTVGINAGVANGVATLDSDGKVPTSQLPPLAVNDTFVVASQAAMLALTAQVGDIAVRTDVTKTFILTASPASTLGNWQEILTPPGVTSITASSPLTGGTITSTGSIGIDQTALSIATTQLTGKITDAQLNSGVTTTGQASKIVKTDSSGGIAATDQISATRFVSGGTSQDSNGFTALNYYYAATGPGKATLIKGGTSSTDESLILPSASGTLIGTGDSKTVTTSMIADNAITHTQIAANTIVNDDISNSAAIAQSKIAQPSWRFIPSSGVDIVPRALVSVTRTLASGTAYFAAFVPETNLTITSLEFNATQAGAANATTPTHKFNVGIFTVNAGGTKPTSLTCQTWGQRNSTTTTMAAFGSLAGTQSFALGYTVTNGTSATNGAPTSITLTAGTTYWIGIHAYANAGFSTGVIIGGWACNAYQFDPYLGLANSGQSSTDFAVSTNVSTGSIQSNIPFCRLIS